MTPGTPRVGGRSEENGMGAAGRIRSRTRSTAVLVGAALVLVAVAVACRPVPLGSAGSSIGNQLSSNCPQFQPSSTAPCGPQPLHWAAIQGPYEDMANGDPFATKCARNTTVSAAACSTGSYPGGATNPAYDPTGYEYAIDVAAEDVGKSLTFQIWDAGVYLRTVGASTSTRTLTANRVAGSTTVTVSGSAFGAADVGETITGTGIPTGAVVTSLISTSSVAISEPALSTGSGSVTLSSTPDCRTSLAPFNDQPYVQQQVTNQNCQTGDSTGGSGPAPLQVQVFENDGNDLTVDYQVPMSACHLYVPPVSDPASYRNTWTSVCTFTPSQVGIYPVRVKSSAITLPNGSPIADVGSGWNAFAMRVTGATGTSLYAMDALSIWSNTPGIARAYLAEVGSDAAGKALVIDLFDVGDASGTGDYAVQVLGPPSGAPNRVPTTGLVIPSAGTADSCRYNPAPGANPGPGRERCRRGGRHRLPGGDPPGRHQPLQQRLAAHPDRHRRRLRLHDGLLVDAALRRDQRRRPERPDGVEGRGGGPRRDRRGDDHHDDGTRTHDDHHHVDGAGPARLAEEPPAVHDALGLNRSTAGGGRGILDGSGSMHTHGGRRRPGVRLEGGPAAAGGEAEQHMDTMSTATGRIGRRRTGRQLVAVAAVGLIVVVLVACKPLPLGGASNQLGNDVAACAQFQPATGCGPQPMVWSAIQGPYERFDNGDPYTTKCARNLNTSPLDASACSGAGFNQLYDPTGYEFAIDVPASDVGSTLTFEIWDAGSYPRTVSGSSVVVSMTAGSAVLNRTSGSSFASSDVGKAVTGTGISAGTVITSYTSTSRVTMSTPATSTGTGRTVIVGGGDCQGSLPPFDASPYYGTIASQNCQTGDQGTAPIQVQVFDSDGNDVTVGYDAPIAGCHLYVPVGSGSATYKNRWATVCTFTPTTAGIHPVRIKSSSITLPDGTVVTDVGSGYNQFALRVTGAPATRLYALDTFSIYTNTPASTARFYLAEVTSADAGKRMVIDLYDPGDGPSGQYLMQVLAPPSGAPGIVPTGGTVIPAAGVADSCRYNPTPSPVKNSDVTAPKGAAATNCTVLTKYGGTTSGHYNNSWLRIQVDIADDYACTTDCWWTIKYDFGTQTSMPTDRTVWSVLLLDPEALPATTTTTTAPTTTTTTEPEPTTTTSTTEAAPTTTTTLIEGGPAPIGGP